MKVSQFTNQIERKFFIVSNLKIITWKFVDLGCETVFRLLSQVL